MPRLTTGDPQRASGAALEARDPRLPSSTFRSLASESWTEVLDGFSDASVYQTHAHDSVLWKGCRLEHALLARGDDLIAAAQVRLFELPLLKAPGIAYVFHGPLWRREGRAEDPEVFEQMAGALYREYVLRRGKVLQVVPHLASDGADLGPLLARGGFRRLESPRPRRTFVLDLRPSLAELRAALRRSWRTNLNKSERRGLTLERGTDASLYGEFLALYDEMRGRKGFPESVDPYAFREVQERLPEKHKLQVWLARHEGVPVTGAVATVHGAHAIELFLANSDRALSVQSAFFTLWRQIEALKELGVTSLDLGGIDPDANPGGYRFKKGLSGRDVTFAGHFEAGESLASRLLLHIVRKAKPLYRRLTR